MYSMACRFIATIVSRLTNPPSVTTSLGVSPWFCCTRSIPGSNCSKSLPACTTPTATTTQVLRIGVDLHVVARRKTTVRLLHHSRLRITRADSSVLFVLAFFLQLLKFLKHLLQPLLAFAGRSLACLGHAPAGFLFALRLERGDLLLGFFERLFDSLLAAKTIRCR